MGASAFHQAPSEILERFSSESEIGFELVGYFLLISSPEQVQATVLEMSNPLLYRIVKEEFKLFLDFKKERRVAKAIVNFLDSKMVQYWKSLPPDRISDFIVYCVRERNDSQFAAQFLHLLSADFLLDLKKKTGLTELEERKLFAGLEEGIYEFPIHVPEIYPLLLQMFTDDPEISLILSTMEALVDRKKVLINAGNSILKLLEDKENKNAHQAVLDYLHSLDKDAALEILSMLQENGHLSSSEKDLLSAYIRGDGDFRRDFSRR
ncbi:hypothetical protein LEP1GSC058_3178 [Leptospira fainei serovar Hurstbridge str. BUT 6]|uniref:Uncharacterized protein n=1 Tax=Leptospira fainei serovar Hurstbridge str. BUT 6 TaxID=1193011 RepID=S3VY76_9LEPT|nr:hypothetical protein LEP1GSC058_3178 [Leptospira fainei serovar Hurstbridge str. BUT 6]